MKIDNYCLFYISKSSPSLGDTLMIYFGENKPITKRNLLDFVITLFNGDEVVGYALLNFSSSCKIKANGNIFLPNDYLIDIINDVLKRNSCSHELAYKDNSGFVVGKILTKKEIDKAYLYEVDISSETLNVESTFDIPESTLVVIAKVDTYLMPQRQIKAYKNKSGVLIRGRICTYEDLEIEIENSTTPLLIMEDNLDIGQDFFIMEEKGNA